MPQDVTAARIDAALSHDHPGLLVEALEVDAPGEAAASMAIRARIVYGLFYWTVNPVEWQAEAIR